MTVLTHRNIAFTLACVIGLGAFAGSAAELIRIAERASYGIPLALVAALDGLSVVCVVVLARQRDWQAVITLAATTVASTVLQALAVPHDQPADRYVSAVAVHVLVPLASFVAVHLATRLDRPERSTSELRTGTQLPAPPPPEPAPVEVPPVPLRKAPARKQPVRPAASLEQLAKQAERVATRRGVDVTALSQRTLMTELKIGTARARELAEHLKANAAPAPLELVASTNGAEP